jgi:Golgi phosphoprotein 3 (GPP34)
MAVLVEDLLLLLLGEDGRRLVDGTALDNALAGAVLLELAQTGRLSPAGPGDAARKGRLVVRDPSPTGEELLDRALARLDAKGPVKAERAVELLTKGLRPALLQRLAERGALRQERSKVFGIFPRTTWPVAAVEHQRQVRARLSDVLNGGQTPDAYTGGLISLLHAIDAVHKVVPGDRKQLKARAAAVGTAAWTSDAVRKAVEAVQTAVIAAVATATAGAAVTNGGGGGST